MMSCKEFADFYGKILHYAYKRCKISDDYVYILMNKKNGRMTISDNLSDLDEIDEQDETSWWIGTYNPIRVTKGETPKYNGIVPVHAYGYYCAANNQKWYEDTTRVFLDKGLY